MVNEVRFRLMALSLRGGDGRQESIVGPGTDEAFPCTATQIEIDPVGTDQRRHAFCSDTSG